MCEKISSHKSCNTYSIYSLRYFYTIHKIKEETESIYILCKYSYTFSDADSSMCTKILQFPKYSFDNNEMHKNEILQYTTSSMLFSHISGCYCIFCYDIKWKTFENWFSHFSFNWKYPTHIAICNVMRRWWLGDLSIIYLIST